MMNKLSIFMILVHQCFRFEPKPEIVTSLENCETDKLKMEEIKFMGFKSQEYSHYP